MQHTLPTTPGALIGHTKHGKPIHLIGGGAPEDGADTDETPSVDDAPEGTDPASTETQPLDAADKDAKPGDGKKPAPNPGPQPGKADDTAGEGDIGALPKWAQKLIRDTRADAAKSRTTAKQTAAEEARAETLAQVAKALGLGEEDQPVDPDQLTAELDRHQAIAWRSGVELQVFRNAAKLGADPEALLDSNSFIDSLDDLVDVDPRSPEFAEALAGKVAEALERQPTKYRVPAPPAPTPTPPAPKPDPSQGPRGDTPKRSPGLAAAVAKALASSK